MCWCWLASASDGFYCNAHVIQAVVNTAVFTLKAHEDVTDQFDFVIDQWRKDVGRGTQVILGKYS